MASKLNHVSDGRVLFHCPGCGWPHAVNVAVNEEFPRRPIWDWNGSDELPTFSPSIKVTGGELQGICHSFVKDGMIQFLSDCKHSLAGQTVPIPDWDKDKFQFGGYDGIDDL